MSAGLIVGIAATTLEPAERERLLHPAVVGVILFSRNYVDSAQLKQLTTEIGALDRERLLICVDQEGGRVQRLRDGFTRLPPLAVLGRWYRSHPDRALDLAYRHGRVMAAEVLAHGIDLSLAPVLDLDRGSRVIGDRAFSDRPDAVVALAAHYLAGMRDAGMKNCGKHFPGHGSVAADSHHEVVRDERDAEALEADLEPFRRLAARLDAVMPAHVIYPAVDDRPAGFSAVWVQTWLREQLGFGGCVISDDLDMLGAEAAGDLSARHRAASEAGCELALVCQPASASALLTGLSAEPDRYAVARDAASGLYGRPMFEFDDQLRVPEFRAWRASLNQIARNEDEAMD